MCIDLLFLGVIVIIVFYLDNAGFVIIVSRYIAVTRTLPLLERCHLILLCDVQPQTSSIFLLFLSVVTDFYSVRLYGLRIAVCPAAATGQAIGSNLDQKMCTASTIGQLPLYLVAVPGRVYGSSSQICLMVARKNASAYKVL